MVCIMGEKKKESVHFTAAYKKREREREKEHFVPMSNPYQSTHGRITVAIHYGWWWWWPQFQPDPSSFALDTQMILHLNYQKQCHFP